MKTNGIPKVAIVGIDRTPADSGMAQIWAEWHTRLGYDVVIAAVWPEQDIPHRYKAFEASTTQVYGVGELVPYNPALGHAYRQQQRCRLVTALSAMAIAFAVTDADIVVLADCETLLLTTPNMLLYNVIRHHDVFGLTLPFKRRREAPMGWLCDKGLVMSRAGFAKLQEYLPGQMERVLAECGDAAAAEGLLRHSLRLCGLVLKTNIMRGYYQWPGGRKKALFSAKMPEGMWLNNGHTIWVEHNQPLFTYLGMATRLDTGMPIAEYFTAMANSIARWFELPEVPTPLRRLNHTWVTQWHTHAGQVRASLRKAKVKTPEKVFWQNWGAMQHAARHYEAHGTLPEANAMPVMGTVAPLDPGWVHELLHPTILMPEEALNE